MRRIILLSLLLMAAAMTVSSLAAVTPWDGTTNQSMTLPHVSRAIQPTTQSLGDVTDLNAALTNAAAYLRKTQADVTEDNAGNGNPDNPDDPDDGGWDWYLTTPPDPISHSTDASPQNVYGVSALGVYYAYLKSPSTALMTTMTDAAVKMAADAGIRSASDLIFLMLYDDLPTVTGTIYQDAAKAKFDSRITQYGSATGLATTIRDVRHSQTWDGLIPWDVGLFVKAAAMLADRYGNTPFSYDQAAADMAEILWQDTYNANPGYFDLTACAGWDPDYLIHRYYYYNLAVTGLIDAFFASNTHTSEISGLLARLKESQTPQGAVCFCYGVHAGDEDWQSTAYAIMTLAAYDRATYQTDINHMGYWLAATQDGSGGWKYSDNTHYPEIVSENTVGIYFAQAPMEVIVDNEFMGQPDVDLYNAAHSTSYVWGYDAFQTITNGVAGVAATGTVNVLAGTYVENVEVNKPVTLAGEAAEVVTVYPSFTGPNPGGGGSLPPDASNIILVQADDVTISGMTLDGDNPALGGGIPVGGAYIDARNGIITDHNISGAVYTNLVVHDCTVKNIYLRGIYASTSGGTFNFHHNVVQNVRGENASIAIFNFGGAGVFDHNTVSDCNDAISANWSRGTTFTSNVVTNSLSGIHTDNAGNYGGSTADLIEDNTISNSQTNGYGIFVFSAYVAPLVNRNTITNVDVGLTCAGSYVNVTPQFTNNTVNGMGKPNATGVYVTTEVWGFASGNVSANFTNNEIANCTDGIYVVAQAGFTNNLTFFDNSLSGNTNSNVIPGEGALAAGTFALQMSGNWWGSSVAATVAASFHSPLADYTPWLDTGADTSPDPGFQGDFHGLWVDDNSPQLGTVNYVQEAVNLVAGSTIHIMPGTYAGQVVVSGFTSLDLLGSGKDSTILTAPATAMTHSFMTSAANYAVLSIENSGTVKVSNLTVDGLGKGNINYRFVGIGYYQSGGTVDGCRTKDFRNTPIDGGGHGLGLYCYADVAPMKTVDIANTEVIGFQKGGIVVVGAFMTGNVHDCTITGYGPATFIAMNGVQISNGATGSVIHNLVSGCSYVGPTWAASGILIYGAITPLATKRNTVTECQIGINYINTGGSIDSNAVNNTPTGTGLTSYWNIVADPVTGAVSHLPARSLFDPPSANAAAKAAPTAYATHVTYNHVDGGGHGTGIEADAYSGQTLEFRATANWVTNFDNGIVLWEDAGATLSSFLVLNRMLTNGLGLYNENGTVDARKNTFTNATNADDNTSGNYYNANCWSDWSGSGPYTVGGTGGNKDMAPSRDCNPECCVGTTGNVNVTGIIDLQDLSLLIAYLVTTPPPTLPCPASANINTTGIIDLSDLSMLIAYLINTPTPALPNCP